MWPTSAGASAGGRQAATRYLCFTMQPYASYVAAALLECKPEAASRSDRCSKVHNGARWHVWLESGSSSGVGQQPASPPEHGYKLAAVPARDECLVLRTDRLLNATYCWSAALLSHPHWFSIMGPRRRHAWRSTSRQPIILRALACAWQPSKPANVRFA